MTVLHVIVSMSPQAGGLPQAVNLMIAGLEKLNVSCEIVSLDSKSDKFIETSPHVIHAIGPKAGPWGYSKNLVPFLLANFDRFDTVILHGLWQYTGFAVYQALNLHAKASEKRAKGSKHTIPKFLVMPHGMLDPYFQKAKDRKIKAIRNWIFWKLIENKIVKRADELLFTCEEEQLLARDTFTPYTPRKETVVGLGILPPVLNEVAISEAFYKKCPQAKGIPYLLFLSRIHIKKGVDLLLRAYKQVAIADDPNGKLVSVPKLVIAGPGWNSPYGKEMRQIISDDKFFEGRVLIVDMLHGNEKWGAIHNCEAFILPSHQENYGIAVVEALACSKPVLISNKINIWREIASSNGGLIEDDTIRGTRKNLEKWFTMTEDFKEEMSQHAARTFTDHFSLEKATASLMQSL